MNVAAGVKATDAVNVGQLKAAVAAVASGAAPAAVAISETPEPPALSVRQVGLSHESRAFDVLQRQLAKLHVLVMQQQERIAQLENRVVSAAK
jgi:autotransporter adhesin